MEIPHLAPLLACWLASRKRIVSFSQVEAEQSILAGIPVVDLLMALSSDEEFSSFTEACTRLEAFPTLRVVARLRRRFLTDPPLFPHPSSLPFLPLEVAQKEILK